MGDLKLAWMRAMDEGAQQLRPLVYDGVMYIANPGGDHLQALDATTGDLIWDYVRDLPEDLRDYSQLGDRTRNLAIYGHHIFHLTADAYLSRSTPGRVSSRGRADGRLSRRHHAFLGGDGRRGAGPERSRVQHPRGHRAVFRRGARGRQRS